MARGAAAAHPAAVAGAAIAYNNGQEQKKAAEKASQQAEANAKKQEKAADEAEAIRLANDTEYGLASYVFTKDLARGQRLIERLEAGIGGKRRDGERRRHFKGHSYGLVYSLWLFL